MNENTIIKIGAMIIMAISVIISFSRKSSDKQMSMLVIIVAWLMMIYSEINA